MSVSKTYFGCLTRQRINENTVPFFVFHARVKDVKQWAGIKRIQDFPEGTQRILRKTRVRMITRFLQADPKNTIPNNILLAFSPQETHFNSLGDKLSQLEESSDFTNGCSGQLDWGFLHFTFDPDRPEHLRPALIVDGQHRLYGMSEYEDENLPVLIVSLINAPLQEQAFQFIVVNSKAVRVLATSAKSIIADIDEDALEERLLKAGVPYGDMSPILRDINDLVSSPFYKLLKWERNRDGIQLVPLTAIEQSIRFTETVFSFLKNDEDSLVEIFMAVWRGVKKRYSELWGKDNKFMTKVNINALNQFLIQRLKLAWEFGTVNIFDVDSVESHILRFLENIPGEFWESEWSIKIQDNANVRQQIEDDLNTIVNNYRLQKQWNDNLQLPLSSL